MSSNPFVKKTSLRASTIMFCYTKVNLIDAPTLSCKRRAPRRLQIGLTDGNFHFTPEDNYRQIYYEALDLVSEATAYSTNQGIKFITMLKILFSRHAASAL